MKKIPSTGLDILNYTAVARIVKPHDAPHEIRASSLRLLWKLVNALRRYQEYQRPEYQ